MQVRKWVRPRQARRANWRSRAGHARWAGQAREAGEGSRRLTGRGETIQAREVGEGGQMLPWDRRSGQEEEVEGPGCSAEEWRQGRADQKFSNFAHITCLVTLEDDPEHSHFLFLLSSDNVKATGDTNRLANTNGEANEYVTWQASTQVVTVDTTAKSNEEDRQVNSTA